MTNQMLENTTIKYGVILNGQQVAVKVTQQLAEQFISTLDQSQQQNASIVPISEGGQQVLLG